MRLTYVQLQKGWEAVTEKASRVVPGMKLPPWLLLVLVVLATAVASQWLLPFSPPPQESSAPHNHVLPVAADTSAQPSSTPSSKAYLGIRGKTFLQGAVQGVKVLDVFPDSPAARAGLRAERGSTKGVGHIIVGVDAQPVRSEEDLGQIMASLSPGDQVQLSVTNATGKTAAVLALTLGAAPETSANAQEATGSDPGPVSVGRATESGSKLTETALRQDNAALAPGPAGSPGRSQSLQSEKPPIDSLAHTPGRATPVAWDGLLSTVSLQTFRGDLPALHAEATDVPPNVIDAYMDKLAIMPVQRTRLVKIAYSTPDPELAARVANMHARAYLRQGIERRGHADGEALRFLQEKLTELKERVEKSELALNRYRRDRGIISLDNRENIVVDRLADLNKRLTEAEADRIALEAQTRLIRKNEYDALPAVIDNRLVQTLKGELARLEGEYADLSTKFKPGYPALDQLQAKVEQAKRRLQQEIQRTVGGIRSAYAAAKQKEDELRTKMEQQKTAALGLKDAAVDYAVLAREVDMNRQIYDSVLQRLKEMEVAAALRASNVSVIDQAVPPLKPSWPNKKLSLLLSAVVGLVGGVGLAFFVEHLNKTLKTPQEVERYLRLPNLGMIPDFLINARRNSPSIAPASPGISRIDEAADRTGFILTHDPFAVTTEAYRTLRAALLLAQAGAPKTLLFTSAMHGEGKTVTVVNTAAILAQMGGRVLVVDADLRRSACHTVLGLHNDEGLTEVLTGHCEPAEVIRSTVSEHLFVLTSGSLPPNPAELVGSQRMRDVLTALQEQYDYVLIDSPPVMLASDAVLLSTMADGVVLVANAQQTPKQVVREAQTRLSQARAKLLGVVLNRLNTRHGAYAYYYRKYEPTA